MGQLNLKCISKLTSEELRKNGIEQFCPTRKHKGKKPTITGSGSERNESKRWKCRNKSGNKPNKEQQRKMMTTALGVAMRTTLKNHIFVFNGEVRKQSKGGAIGVKAAGDIAGLFMIWWDRKFKEKVREEGLQMKMYTRYVDDETIVCKAFEETSENREEEPDKRTMKKMQEIANSIHPSIQMTTDYPSKNENGRLPILNTEQWIEDIEIDGQVKRLILYSHFSKPMANKYVVLENSALASKSKENILVADLLTVMMNVSVHCTNEERTKKVQMYMNRMQHSGYSKKKRATIYRKAKEKYDRKIQRQNEGSEPLYKGKWWNLTERTKEKKSKKNNWYKKDGSEAVFFVNATPNKSLANACSDEFKKAGLRVTVVERTGTTIKKMLVKSNPFKATTCGDQKCYVCALGVNFSCKDRDCVYRMFCQGINKSGQKCTDVNYEGETARSEGERFGEHMRLVQSQCDSTRKKSVFFDHIREEHGNVNPRIGLEIIAKCPGDTTMRQAIEAVSIRENKPVLNGKDEWTNDPRQRKEKTRTKRE